MVEPRLKRLPAIWETWIRSLGREEPLEKEMATHSSILARESHGWKGLVGYSPRVANSWIRLSNFTFTLMRTARFICVCFNSVFCVVIFDGHFALSGHHLV